MTLSLRARLTLWYSLILLVVLLAAGLAVVWLHATLGLARLDSELRDKAATVTASLRAEFDEVPVEPGDDAEDADDAEQPDAEKPDAGQPNPAAQAVEGLQDLELPGTGVAVLAPDGALLALRSSGVRSLAPSELRRVIGSGSADGSESTAGLRVHHGLQRSRTREFRVATWTSLANYDLERATLIRALWLGVPLALIVASLGGWIIGERGLRPLAVMARQAEAMTPDRSDARLTVPHRRDELGVLASAFNGLLDRLAGALRMQRQFMADASHQLRTPTSIARTAAQVTLRGTDRDSQEYRDALSIIEAQTRRLTAIIERMFTLALADLNARPLQLTDLYLDELVHDCARAAHVLAASRRLEIRVDAPPEVLFHGDEGLLREMIMNLVENAVRHTPPEGTVELALTANESEVRLAISDTGPGIPEADQARIFERFVRLENAESAGGGGLGLPIAVWVARAHGGSLSLESSSPDGSRFVVTLPVNGYK